jgi:hypothetical protein
MAVFLRRYVAPMTGWRRRIVQSWVSGIDRFHTGLAALPRNQPKGVLSRPSISDSLYEHDPTPSRSVDAHHPLQGQLAKSGYGVSVV